MVYPGLVNRSRTIRKNARPRYRKTKIGNVKLFYQVNILLIAIIKIAGGIMMVAV
jgi:hypothetical protein